MSYALSQLIISLGAESHRKVIIDSTLSGIGRGAGNTATELLAYYLNKNVRKSYDLKELISTIDSCITPLTDRISWGYNNHNFLAGCCGSHVNTIKFLAEKHHVSADQMYEILNSVPEYIKKRYVYPQLEAAYEVYRNH